MPMRNARRYPFLMGDDAFGKASLRPVLPMTLRFGERTLSVIGLLDTGAAVNVLPYGVGVDLGAVWDRQTTVLRLTGNLANYEARLLVVEAGIGDFRPVRLAFAWTMAEHAPLLLGQVNFFTQFDVCFYRSAEAFDLSPSWS